MGPRSDGIGGLTRRGRETCISLPRLCSEETVFKLERESRKMAPAEPRPWTSRLQNGEGISLCCLPLWPAVIVTPAQVTMWSGTQF